MDTTAENSLREFLRGLRISLGNASIYAEGHSVFSKSVDELKKKIDEAFVFFRPLEIFVSPQYLLVNEKKLEKDSLYQDLAKFLHRRNIKSLKFKEGAPAEELNFFLAKTGMRPSEILKQGGLSSLLGVDAGLFPSIKERQGG
jgi:hypothetical protein